MITRRILACLIAAECCAASSVYGQSETAKSTDCFTLRDIRDWKADGDRMINVRLAPNRYYRLNLAGTCALLRSPQSRVSLRGHGSDRICSALDWDLRVTDSTGGATEQCVVESMEPLTGKQIAAIPRHLRP